MVIEPLRRVRRTTYDIPLTFGIRDALVRLADLPPSLEVPYLTICLDWTPAGTDPGRDAAPLVKRSQWRVIRNDTGRQRRPARTVMENELNRMIEEAGARGEVVEALRAAADRIARYIDAELDPAAQGVYIVANAALGVFEPIALGVPLETSVTAGPLPVLTPLAKQIDDHPAYMVLLADQQEATIALIRRARRGRTVWLEGTDYPKRTQRGGESQARYQRRVDERINAFARHIADETLRALQREEVDTLIVAGDEVITSALNRESHHTVQEAIVDTIRLGVNASEQEILDATLPIAERVEREQELATVERIANAVAAGGRGVSGTTQVLRALQMGQASGIAMVDDFREEGWADFTLDLYGTGPVPDTHPTGGDVANLVPVALENEMIRLAVQTSARIEIVKTAVDGAPVGVPDGGEVPRTEAAQRLDALGGVGATLRYTAKPAS